MIDWRVRINGQNPPDWDHQRDGCWFPNFELQKYLLPIFDVGEQPIDEYSDTVFSKKAMMRLKTHLTWQRGFGKLDPIRGQLLKNF
jgi:hypothetical protein